MILRGNSLACLLLGTFLCSLGLVWLFHVLLIYRNDELYEKMECHDSSRDNSQRHAVVDDELRRWVLFQHVQQLMIFSTVMILYDCWIVSSLQHVQQLTIYVDKFTRSLLPIQYFGLFRSSAFALLSHIINYSSGRVLARRCMPKQRLSGNSLRTRLLTTSATTSSPWIIKLGYCLLLFTIQGLTEENSF